MQLVRNKRTGDLYEIDDLEAEMLCTPEEYIRWVNSLLSEKIYNTSIDMFANIDTKMVYRLGRYDIVVMDIISGELEIIPNTPASRALYGR
jgi:hypothetical protein